ncbi:MAG TPA: MJ1255/VC2487 family glycosyltransferase [Desulfobacterales bacterium]
MNILYGVQSTGNGHISRSKEVIARLKELGHAVRVLFSGQNPRRLKDIETFAPYEIRQGLTFHTRQGRLQPFKTALNLNLIRFYRDIHQYDATDIDLVITDYEPISSRIAGRFDLPCIGIGHQYAFCYDIPVSGDNFLTRWVMNRFAPVAYPVGLHWHHFNTAILPPIVPQHLKPAPEIAADKVLVYLPFEATGDIESLLQPLTTHQFHIWGIQEIEVRIDRGHLHWHPFSREGFLNDLEQCRGVITNAGFELASEALHLGKKLLVKPLAGQLEQVSNALAVEQLGLGMVMERLDRNAVALWLEQPAGSPMSYPDVAGLITDWIESGRWEDIEGLAKQAWDRTRGTLPPWP